MESWICEKMKGLFRKTWFIVLVTAIVTAGAVSGIWLTVSRMSEPTYGGYVAVIKLSGNIAYQRSPISILGATLTPEDVEELVEEVEVDPYARAVVLYSTVPVEVPRPRRRSTIFLGGFQRLGLSWRISLSMGPRVDTISPWPPMR